MTNRTLTLAPEVLNTLRVFFISERSQYHGIRNFFEKSQSMRSVWTLAILFWLSSALFAQTPVEQYRQNLQRQKQLSQAQYQQKHQQVPTQYQQRTVQNQQRTVTPSPAQYQQQYQQRTAQNQQRTVAPSPTQYQRSQNNASVTQSNVTTSGRNISNQRQTQTKALPANNQQPIHYRTVPQQSVRSNSNNFQQKMMRQSPVARSTRSPQFVNGLPIRTQNNYDQNNSSALPANNGYHSQNGYPNSYSNNYANSTSGRPQQQKTQQPSRLSRMKFSLSNSTQSALVAEQIPTTALQNGQNSKTSSAGPSAGSVWTAFLTGKYSPELVEWYVNRYQEKNANLNGRQNFDLYNARQNVTIQTGGELSMASSGYDQYRENQLAGYASRNPEAYAQTDPSLYRTYRAANGNIYRQPVADQSQNPYYAGAFRQNSINRMPNDPSYVNSPLNNGIALNNAYNSQETSLKYPAQDYINDMNSSRNERSVLNSHFPTVSNVPLAERSRYQSSLSALFKKKEKTPVTSSQQLLAMQRQELQRQQEEFQRRQWELRQLEDRRTMEYQRQLAINSSRDQAPRSYSNTESYNNSRYYNDGPLSDEYNNYNSNQLQQGAVIVNNHKNDFAQRWAKISARQEELAREQQWLAEQQSLLAQENSNLVAPHASGELPPPRPLVDQQVAYSQDYSRNAEQSVAKLPSENYNNSYEEVNAPIQQVSGSIPYYQMPQTQNRSNQPRYESIQQNSSIRQPATTQKKKNSGANVYYPKGDFVP